MVLIDELQRYKGSPTTLEFDDGEIVEALLLGVDPDEHEDITYDVLKVLKSVGKTYERSKVYVAPIHSVRRVAALPSHGDD